MSSRRIYRVTSRAPALAEVAAMVAVVLSYIWSWQGSFGGAGPVVLGLYVGLGVLGHARRRERVRDLGLRLDNFPIAIRNAAFVAIPVIALTLLIGAALGSLHFHGFVDSTLRFLKSIAWGTAQQYGLLCILYRRLDEIFDSHVASTAAAALLFAAFHVPNVFLTAVTLAAGAAACMLYRREPNIWAIGIAHGAISSTLLYSLPDGVTHGLQVGPGYWD